MHRRLSPSRLPRARNLPRELLLLGLHVLPLAACDVTRDGAVFRAADAALLPPLSDEEARRTWLEGTLALGDTAPATSAGPGNARPPALPRAVVDVKAPPPAPGARTLRPRDGAALQAALDGARGGDVILLAPGATYTGNFVLRRHASASAWVTIRTGPGGAAGGPPAGTRVTPALARSFARLVSPNREPALRTAAGAHHYRIERVEIGVAPEVQQMTAIVALGDAWLLQRTAAQVPHHLVLDRVYVHGTPTLDVRRCVDLHGATTAVVDSYITDCHARGFDSQAIFGSNGPGPFTIENNYLAGAGENVMFGGSDPQIAALVPSDITFRRNHLVKPMAWKGVWSAKNLLELKLGKRVLIEGNVFENSWVDGQTGFAILLWSVNQGGGPKGGGAPWSETSDVTVRRNVVRHAANGFQITDRWEGAKAVPMARVAVEHNVISDIGVNSIFGAGGARAFQVSGNVPDLRIAHNTTVRIGGPWIYFVSQPATPIDRLTVLDNLLDQGHPAVRSDYGVGGEALALFGGPGTVMRGNVLGGWEGGLVPGNYSIAPGERLFPMQAESRGDLRLPADSRWRGRATDGEDPGADVAAVMKATAGVTDPSSER